MKVDIDNAVLNTACASWYRFTAIRSDTSFDIAAGKPAEDRIKKKAYI